MKLGAQATSILSNAGSRGCGSDLECERMYSGTGKKETDAYLKNRPMHLRKLKAKKRKLRGGQMKRPIK